MKFSKPKAFIFLFIVLSLIFSLTASASTVRSYEIPFESYTYWEGFSGKTKKAVFNKPMYMPDCHLTADSIGVEAFKELKDVFCDSNGYTYILDSRGSRLIILNKDYTFHHEITQVLSINETFDFTGARGLFVTDDGRIFIADTEHARVLITDLYGNLKNTVCLPESPLIPEDFQFRPIAIVVSNTQDLYILSEGSYYGALVYNEEFEFQGFYGANTVKNTLTEGIANLWNKLFITDSKREVSERALPFQFSDLCIDSKGFIYTTTGKTEADSNGVGQIKKLSPTGNSILGGDGYNYVEEGIVDTQGDGISSRVQDLLSIAVDENDHIYALDSAYGRVYVYNEENRLLTAIGGGVSVGSQVGTFSMACAVAVHYNDILVVDSTNNNVTVFKQTDYGEVYTQANRLTKDGNYAEAKPLWEKVLGQDENNQLAYSSMAKILIAEGNYDKALEYAKAGYDRDVYETAFEQVRTAFLNRHFTAIFIGVVLLIAAISAGVVLVKKKNIVLVKNIQVRLMFRTISHPFDTFDRIKEMQEGSVLLCLIIVAVYYILSVLKSTHGGFLFVYFDAANYNSIFVLLRSMGAVFLWTFCNWAVCTLMDGKGTLKNIFIATSYSILPLIFSDVVFIFASNVLTSSEGVFLSLFSVLMGLITFFYLAIAMIRIHDFSFGRFILTGLFTVLGMVLVIFFAFLIGILVQQLYGFIITLTEELISVIGGKLV